MSKPNKHGTRIRWMKGGKVMKRALNPDAVEALLFSERGNEAQGEQRMRNARKWNVEHETLDEEGWTRFWNEAEEKGYADGDEEEVGSNPQAPPEMCIKLRDCSLWCEPD